MHSPVVLWGGAGFAVLYFVWDIQTEDKSELEMWLNTWPRWLSYTASGLGGVL